MMYVLVIFLAAAIKTDGTLWVWGYSNGFWRIRDKIIYTHYSSPVQIPGTTWTNKLHLQQVGSGYFATKTDGTLWSWGSNT